MATSRWDRAAKKFSRPPDDRANIYVFRRGSPSTKVQLFLDGVPASTLGSYSFTVLTVRPGRHSLVSRRGGRDFQLILEIVGGFNYYVSQGEMSKDSGRAVAVAAVFGGLVGAAAAAGFADASTPDLELVDRAEGREAVRHCNLIAEVPPALPPLPKPVAPAADEGQEADNGDLPPGW
jgi:hypothetical protein